MCSIAENEVRFASMGLRKCQECVHNNRAFSASAVICVSFIYSVPSYWFVDSAARPNLRRTAWREERETFPPGRLADLRKPLKMPVRHNI